MDIQMCQDVVGEDGLRVEKTKISFINRVFGKFGKSDKNLDVLILSNSLKDIQKPTSPVSPKQEVEDTTYEVTGTPLEHDFGEDSFNVSTVAIKRNWYKFEEKYLPISITEATRLISSCTDDLQGCDSWKNPIVCIVDPSSSKDNEVLIGNNPDSRGFMTFSARLAGVATMSKVQNDVEALLVQHLSDTHPSKMKNPRIEITAIYEIYGIDPEITDFSEERKIEFPGFLKVETSWQELTFTPPLRKSSSCLKAAIVSGSKTTPLCSLWEELLLIDKFLKILEEYQQKNLSSRYSVAPLHFPKGFHNPFLQESSKIAEKLNKFLNGDYDFDEIDLMGGNTAADTSSDDNTEIKLASLVKSLEKRHSQDFTDLLWNIVKETESYNSMTDCIHTVFEEIGFNDFKPLLNSREDTRFARMLGALDPMKKQLPQLAGSVSIELVIDIGLEKLARDYGYLISSGNLMESYEVKKMFEDVTEGDFDISKYRKKLMTLAQIHISLEFLQLIQTQLTCRVDFSRSIFQAGLKAYRNHESPLKLGKLHNHEIYTLNTAAPRDIVTEVIKTPPASWMCTVTTETELQKSSTITHYSRTPIFPPNIYTSENCQEIELDHQTELMYHITKGSIHLFNLFS